MSFNATIIGRIIRIDDVRQVGKNKDSVLDMAVAIDHPRKEGDNWVREESTIQNVTVWRSLADHTANSLKVGDRVIVTGKLTTGKDYENKDGDMVTPRPVLTADAIGPDLLFNDVEVLGRRERNDDEEEKTSKKKPAAKKRTAKKAPKVADDDIFDDDDSDDDDFFDLDDDDF